MHPERRLSTLRQLTAACRSYDERIHVIIDRGWEKHMKVSLRYGLCFRSMQNVFRYDISEDTLYQL